VRLDSARELKGALIERLPELGVQGAPENPTGGWLALGIAPTGPGGYSLAVRMVDPHSAGEVLTRLAREAADEIDVRAVGRIVALTAPGDLQRRRRPLVPGCSVAHPDVTAGTLGGFVTVDGVLHALSNNHVLGNSGLAKGGDAALQPGPADGGRDTDDRIGVLAALSELDTTAANLIDAALAVIDQGVAAEPGAYPGGPLPTVVEGPPAQADVEKLGRTTGLTRGRVTAFEVDGLRINFPDAELVFDDQIEIAGDTGPFSAEGDSGSVIWTADQRAALGLLFAGSATGGPDGTGLTYGNALATVLAEFGAQWAGGAAS